MSSPINDPVRDSMSDETFDPRPAARLLAEAWHSGELLRELPAAIRPMTMSQGYDVQDCLIDALAEPVAGWKLGVGSAAQKRESGVGRSIAGRILRSRLHGSGATVGFATAAPITIECEIAYVLGHDVEPDMAIDEPMVVVGEVRLAFELVRSRFIDRRAVGWPSFAADDGAFHALILGESIAPAAIADVRRTLRVSLDGDEAVPVLAGNDATDPLAALGDLIAIARERGMRLPAGSIVSTGTMTKPFDVVPTQEASIVASCQGQTLAFRLSSSARAV